MHATDTSSPEPAWELVPGTAVTSPSGSPLGEILDRIFGPMRTNRGGVRPENLLVLDTEEAEGRLRVRLNGRPVFSAPSEAELPPILESALVIAAVRHRSDRIVFHAGAVELDANGVLLPGRKGSGKSTLALWLAENGGTYAGDEIVFFNLVTDRWESFPKAVTIKRGSFDLFEEAEAFHSLTRGPLRYVQPETAAPPFTSTGKIELIVAPQYTPGAGLQVTRLSPGEAALLLIHQCMGGLNRDARALSAVAELAAKPACVIEYDDVTRAGETIKELCS